MSRWSQRGAAHLNSVLASPTGSSLMAFVASKRVRMTLVIVLLFTTAVFLFQSDLGHLQSMSERLLPMGHRNGSTVLSAAPDGNRQGPEGIIDWSRFAYGQYVTNDLYLCNSVMLFARLHELGSRAARVMMYPSKMLSDPNAAAGTAKDDDARLILKARDDFGVKLVPITVQHRASFDPTWAESFTKLLAFNQTQYDRILSLDSDSTVLQNMDELFLLPPATVALPRAYWLYPEKKILSSQIMLIQPSEAEFARVQDKIEHAGSNDYDMEIINDLYGDSALVIPHRPYDLLTREFTRTDPEQAWYLGNPDEVWDPVSVYNEAKFLHFSDWPVPKPWLPIPQDVMREHQPACEVDKARGGVENCAARDLWNGFYTDFKERRKRVCEIGRRDARVS